MGIPEFLEVAWGHIWKLRLRQTASDTEVSRGLAD